jgi:hypothetical protein
MARAALFAVMMLVGCTGRYHPTSSQPHYTPTRASTMTYLRFAARPAILVAEPQQEPAPAVTQRGDSGRLDLTRLIRER